MVQTGIFQLKKNLSAPPIDLLCWYMIRSGLLGSYWKATKTWFISVGVCQPCWIGFLKKMKFFSLSVLLPSQQCYSTEHLPATSYSH